VKYVITAKASGKELFYTGDKFSNARPPKTFFSKRGAVSVAQSVIARFPILEKYRVYIRPFRQPKRKPKKKLGTRSVASRAARKTNPSLRDAELQQAGRLLEEFSGHTPTEVLRVSESPMRKGLVIGQLDGVLYTTVRDGKTESYIHKFRKKSRPLLTARADGKQLGIVGGRFQMTEAGIEDR
jgi:hypothetical protein